MAWKYHQPLLQTPAPGISQKKNMCFVYTLRERDIAASHAAAVSAWEAEEEDRNGDSWRRMKETEGAPNGLNMSWVHSAKRSDQRVLLGSMGTEVASNIPQKSISPGEQGIFRAHVWDLSHPLDGELPRTNHYTRGEQSCEFNWTCHYPSAQTTARAYFRSMAELFQKCNGPQVEV